MYRLFLVIWTSLYTCTSMYVDLTLYVCVRRAFYIHCGMRHWLMHLLCLLGIQLSTFPLNRIISLSSVNSLSLYTHMYVYMACVVYFPLSPVIDAYALLGLSVSLHLRISASPPHSHHPPLHVPLDRVMSHDTSLSPYVSLVRSLD